MPEKPQVKRSRIATRALHPVKRDNPRPMRDQAMWWDEFREVVWLTTLVAGLSLLSVGIAVAIVAV